MSRFLLAPLFGIAVAACFVAGWVALDRAFTARALTATIEIGAGSAMSALAALVAVQMQASRPWSARLATAMIMLIAGAAGSTSLLMGVQLAWATHPMADLPLHVAMVVIAIVSAGALYGFLSIAAFVILPLGVPVFALFAWFIAGRR